MISSWAYHLSLTLFQQHEQLSYKAVGKSSCHHGKEQHSEERMKGNDDHR